MPAAEIMRKFKAGTLKSGSGHKVTSPNQAKAIAASYGKSGDEKRSNMHNAASDVLSGKDAKPKGKGKVREMSIRNGHKGGFIVKHHVEHEDGQMAAHEYPVASKKALLQHVEQHAQEEQAEMGAGGGEGAPQAQEIAAEGNE